MDNNGFRKQSDKVAFKSHKRSSLTEGVPMLEFGPDGNLREVERCLQIIVVVKFGLRLDFFEKMEYPNIPPPKFSKNKYASADDPGYRIMTDKLFNKFAEEEFNADQNKPRLYAMIMGILSADGESAVRQHANFANTAGDPLAL